jgi:hypothetical protein
MKQALLICVSTFLIFIICSCDSSSNMEKTGSSEVLTNEIVEGDAKTAETPSPKNREPESFKVNNRPKLDDYIAVLDATKRIAEDKTGTLRVWIGTQEYKPSLKKKIIRDEISFPASIGQYARITPIAPDFDIEPKVSGCVKIHPSGSSEIFTLIPKKRGKFKISAKIELFECEDCSGTPIPKTTEILTVSVKIDGGNLFGQLFDILWDNFLIFFSTVVGILFAAAVVVIRHKVNKNNKDGEQEN